MSLLHLLSSVAAPVYWRWFELWLLYEPCLTDPENSCDWWSQIDIMLSAPLCDSLSLFIIHAVPRTQVRTHGPTWSHWLLCLLARSRCELYVDHSKWTQSSYTVGDCSLAVRDIPTVYEISYMNVCYWISVYIITCGNHSKWTKVVTQWFADLL